MLYFRLRCSKQNHMVNLPAADCTGATTTTNVKSTEIQSQRNSGCTSSNSSSIGGVGRDSCWERVVQAHVEDMWVDLPGVQQQLGATELAHLMQLYSSSSTNPS
mmetsp:Transcript_4070/g.6686  ORF Transcript_4070/g.6686 Transcript_4070/m.6686 type:complete len:104 (-) Transcript_4070:99-410(-)